MVDTGTVLGGGGRGVTNLRLQQGGGGAAKKLGTTREGGRAKERPAHPSP